MSNPYRHWHSDLRVYDEGCEACRWDERDGIEREKIEEPRVGEPTRPTAGITQVVSRGTAHHEVVQATVGAQDPSHAWKQGHSMVAAFLYERDRRDADALAVVGVQALGIRTTNTGNGMWEVTVLAFWRSERDPS